MARIPGVALLNCASPDKRAAAPLQEFPANLKACRPNALTPPGQQVKPDAMVRSPELGEPPSLAALQAAGPVAVFLDFDGTLVEIAPTPAEIAVPEGLAARLEVLARRLDGRLALVSGRSTANIAAHLGTPAIARAGSHGIERVTADGARFGEEPAPLSPAIDDAMRIFAGAHRGIEYEAKKHGAALHFRAVPELEHAAVAFAERQAVLHGLWVKPGKFVIELVNQGADKAGAVRAFMGEEPFAGAMPVFVGDDVTDEDGFRAAGELGGFGVVVGARGGTLARYCLDSPAKVLEWLEL
jgi:trehalose 6-phosphate phosphatase